MTFELWPFAQQWSRVWSPQISLPAGLKSHRQAFPLGSFIGSWAWFGESYIPPVCKIMSNHRLWNDWAAHCVVGFYLFGSCCVVESLIIGLSTISKLGVSLGPFRWVVSLGRRALIVHRPRRLINHSTCLKRPYSLYGWFHHHSKALRRGM